MNAQIEAPADHELAPGKQRGRSVASWVVLVIAGVLLLLSSFAVWIDRVALNTAVFTDTSASLLDDDAIRSAVATRAVDELFDSVDVQAEVEAQLPKDLKSLSGPATAALRQASYTILNRALEQPALQRVFRTSLEESHKTLVEVLEGGGARVSTDSGIVTLDLREIVREAADRIGIGEQVADKIPAKAGQIVVLRSDELDTAQDAFQLLKTLARVLPLLTLAAFGLAVWLAAERRRAVRGVGVTFIVVGVLGLLAARLTGTYVVNALVAEKDTRKAADNAWDVLTDLMRSSFRLMIAVGILFVAAAWLAGPGHRALATRRALAPAVRNRGWAYAGLALVAVILLVIGSVSDFTRFLVVAVLVALGAAWIELMRVQTLREFPDVATSALLADTRTRVSDWWEKRRAEAPASNKATAPPSDLTARLSSLADLHARGELTDEEYASAKSRVLSDE